jgi:hypothetical protein
LFTGRATAAHEGVRIHFLTITAWPYDWTEHLLMVTSRQFAGIDPHQTSASQVVSLGFLSDLCGDFFSFIACVITW